MNTKDTSTDTGKTDYALSVLKELDRYKNLNRVAATFVFVTAAAIGVLTFFLTLDFLKWFGIKAEEPWMQLSIPFILIFLVWIIVYFSIQSVLQMLGTQDLHTLSKHRLSDLNLSLSELSQLRRSINDEELKHKKLFETVIIDLASRSNPQCD